MSTYNAIKYNVSFANAGGLKLIKTLTASSSSTLSFVDGSSDVVLDSTYRTYLFKFINIHPSAAANFSVGFRDGSTAYDAIKTSTAFYAYHNEADTAAALSYYGAGDLAQGTGFQQLAFELHDDADQSCSGELFLFNPSSTTYVKHFMSKAAVNTDPTYITNSHIAGYINTTSAIDAVQFKMSSGNIDAGVIKLYGIA